MNGRGRTLPGAHWTLFVLFLTNVFNVGDRTLLGVVTEPVRIELALSDTEMSLLNGLLFVLFNLGGGLFIARFIDAGNRKRILLLGLCGWSIATAGTGLADDFLTLAIARMAVGVGEATAFPAAMSLIPDLFEREARGSAVGIYQSSGFVGIIVGTVAAGVLAAAFGWRMMFVICGAAGLVVAIMLFLTVREPAREFPASRRIRQDTWLSDLVASCRRILSLPGFLALALAFGVSAMMAAVIGAWGPAFLQRSHDVPLAEVGLAIGPAVALGGIGGTLLSGYLADRLVSRDGRLLAMLRIPLIALPLAAPCMAGFVFLQDVGAALLAMGLMNFMLGCAVAPFINYAISHTEPGDRALTSTILLASSGLIGGGLGPFLVGMLSDSLSPSFGRESLRYAISAMIATPLLATGLLILTTRQASRYDPPNRIAA